ncbi:MAG: small multi-drug export protein [archaeon]|nr:MAG: small multi-drug export protein [archaeon]
MIVPEINHLLTLALITIVPWIELRGSIPYGISKGLDTWFVFLFTLVLNVIIIPVIYWGLQTFYQSFFIRFKVCRTLVERVRKRGTKYIDKYGIPGLIIFVGIPLPGTGAYSGTILAWLLGMEKKKAFASIAIGVSIAAVLVTLFSVGFFKSI